MKRLFSGDYLNVLFLATVVIMAFSIAFTLITGESPLEALGISPIAGTIGTVVLVVILAVAPGIVRKIRQNAN